MKLKIELEWPEIKEFAPDPEKVYSDIVFNPNGVKTAIAISTKGYKNFKKKHKPTQKRTTFAKCS